MMELGSVVYVDRTPRSDVPRVLSDVGASVERVSTLADCLEALEGAACVVAECDLPDASGVDVCERIRARDADVPLLIYTDAGTEALAGEVVAAGADGYVPKSQGVETVVTRVVELLADRERTAGRSSGTSEDRLESLIDQSPLAIMRWNVAGEAIGWNPASEDLFGYSRAEALGTHAADLLAPEEGRTAERGFWDDILASGESHRGVRRSRRRDGSTMTCEWVDTPLVDEEGDVVSVLSFAQDVTAEFKRADALEALQGATHDLLRAESATEIADVTVGAVGDVLDHAVGSVRLYDESAEALECVAVTDGVRDRLATLEPIGPGDNALWTTYERGEPLAVDDADRDLLPHVPDAEAGSLIVHPLGDHGVLTVAAGEPDAFEDTDARLVHVLATTTSAALDRAAHEAELARAKTIVETSGDGVYWLDRDGTFRTVNDAMVSITGYDREALLGEHISKTLTEESVERGRSEIRAVLEADDDYVATYELTLETRSGDRIPCEVSMTVLREDGRFAGTVGIVRDVSERKWIERKLRERQRKTTNLHEVVSAFEGCRTEADLFETTVEAANGVLNFDVCLIGTVRGDDLRTEAVSADHHAEECPERTTVDETVAWRTYRSQETIRLGDDEVGVACASAERFRSILSVPVGDRGVFQAVSTAPRAFDRQDEELAELLLSHVSDALERMAFEARLKAERDRFVALFENVPDAIVSARHEAGEPVVERVNPAFERVFGYEEDDLLGASLDRFVVPSNEVARAGAINRRGANGDIVETEVKRRTADGLRDFMLRIVPIERDADNSHAFGLYTDVTEQKQRQKRVEILNRVLRHDLRNGMNIINGCAEMLAGVLEDDGNLQYAETIQERAGELISLAEKTRAVERTLDRGDAATGPVDVVDAVETALESIREEYPDASVTSSLPERAHARADDMLETAIFHVVENAVEHNDMPRAEIHVSLEESEDTLTLSIADNGPGVPEDERALLQEEKEITQLRHASGLGLWLVNWVVTQSGGQLSFAENDPRGTIVSLEVPSVEPVAAGAIGDGAAAGG